jgi:hypothetical protein
MKQNGREISIRDAVIAILDAFLSLNYVRTDLRCPQFSIPTTSGIARQTSRAPAELDSDDLAGYPVFDPECKVPVLTVMVFLTLVFACGPFGYDCAINAPLLG